MAQTHSRARGTGWRRLLIRAAAVAGLVALTGCYYGPYPYGYYGGYPGYYGAPVAGVYLHGGYGGRYYWR
jgi:hypothetical protein